MLSSSIMSSEKTKATKRKRGDSSADTEHLLELQPGNELQVLKRGILCMSELEVACRSMEKELHAEWSYSAPPLFLLSSNDGCIESDARSIVDQKCRELEARRSFLENALHVFRDDSYTRIPLTYWTNQGFDQDYVTPMEHHLIGQLRELTHELLTNAGKRKRIRLNPYESSEESDYEGEDDEDGPVMQHDDILLPLWEKFANALRVQHFHSNEIFSIRNVQLHPTVLNMLGPALRMKIDDNFDLARNEFPDMGAGVDFVHTVSESNSRVKSVHCLDSELGDDSLKLAHLVLARVNLCSNILRENRRLSSSIRMSQPLSLMYEILRGWRMPELYEQNASRQDSC